MPDPAVAPDQPNAVTCPQGRTDYEACFAPFRYCPVKGCGRAEGGKQLPTDDTAVQPCAGPRGSFWSFRGGDREMSDWSGCRCDGLPSHNHIFRQVEKRWGDRYWLASVATEDVRIWVDWKAVARALASPPSASGAVTTE